MIAQYSGVIHYQLAFEHRYFGADISPVILNVDEMPKCMPDIFNLLQVSGPAVIILFGPLSSPPARS